MSKLIDKNINLKSLFTLLSLSFLSYSVLINFDKLIKTELNESIIIYLTLSLIVSSLSLFLNALAWNYLMIWLGFDIDNLKIVPLYLDTNLLKYLPGGIWHFIERYRSLKIYIGSVKALIAVVLEPFLMLSSALFLVPFSHLNNLFYFIFFFPSALLFRELHTALIVQLVSFKFHQFKKLDNKLSLGEESLSLIRPQAIYPIKAFLIEVGFVLLRFIGFWLCLHAFSLSNQIHFIECLSLFSLSWVIGLVVPSAPGGVGIFESSILLFSGNSLPNELTLLTLISYRLIVSLADIIASIFIRSNNLKFS
ncbi:UPF0104 family protein [Prochlorococcus marinus]|uniref:UPF0104 family protein n=1 Tax=Prochlorococcus marinus TaxID=1219 RepID=UPI0022B30B1E|nr:UPF0104 family protein [Prochlorococcus marinus]